MPTSLGVEPYFRKEFGGALAYVEFRIGDYSHELGILDRRYVGPTPEHQGGTVAYWAVDDVQAAYDRLIELGATPHQPVTEQGPGFVTASVIDPFGNPLGVMFNQHYLDVRGAMRPRTLRRLRRRRAEPHPTPASRADATAAACTFVARRSSIAAYASAASLSGSTRSKTRPGWIAPERTSGSSSSM